MGVVQHGPADPGVIPEERRRELARLRKRRQREREQDGALAVRRVEYRVAATEREAIARGARAGGYDDEIEYLLELVNRDLSRNGLERLKQ